MIATVVPAQIITVEDKIAGNLALSQIVILMIPLISALIIYIIFPPVMKFSLYKISMSLVIALLSLPLAIRMKGEILFRWITILLRFNLRPGMYVFNKNDQTQRIVAIPLSKTI